MRQLALGFSDVLLILCSSYFYRFCSCWMNKLSCSFRLCATHPALSRSRQLSRDRRCSKRSHSIPHSHFMFSCWRMWWQSSPLTYVPSNPSSTCRRRKDVTSQPLNTLRLRQRTRTRASRLCSTRQQMFSKASSWAHQGRIQIQVPSHSRSRPSGLLSLFQGNWGNMCRSSWGRARTTSQPQSHLPLKIAFFNSWTTMGRRSGSAAVKS